MPFPLTLVFYLGIGLLSGVIGGLLGVGGGSIIVPSLLLLFSYLGFPDEHLMHIAIGTSLAAMVINTCSAAYFHHRRSSVVWKVILRLVLGIAMGAFLGSFLASELSSGFLKKLFGGFTFCAGIYFMLPAPKTAEEAHRMPGFFPFTLIGTGIAALANLIGIGGGIFMVPLLLYFKFTEKKAIATSSASSFLISLGGAIGYLIAADNQLQIPGCIGYIYIPAFLVIGVTSFFSSFYGVKWAHSLPSSILRKIFAITMLVVGLSMLLS